MAMVDMKDLLHHAFKNRYAVGAFEVVNLDFLQATIDAAEKARSPVILNIVEPHFELYDLELLMIATVRAAQRASVPVAVHMDHCASLKTIEAAIGLGCNSVKLDAASESFPVNVDRTRDVVKLAHDCGIPVEGEIGCVTGMKPDVAEQDAGAPVYTPVEEAKAYIEKTGVDFLAVSIGTIHGRLKTKPRLDYTRLSKIQEKVNIPCVIHGGTGLTEQQVRKLIDHGVAKINYFTTVAETYTRQIESNIKEKKKTYQQMFADVRKKLSEELFSFMQILNSAGRAAEVLIQCRPWENLETMMIYEPQSDDPNVIARQLNQGKEELRKIPGVINVKIGRTLDKGGNIQYCWMIQLAGEAALEIYKSHPVYEAYSEQRYSTNSGRSGEQVGNLKLIQLNGLIG